MRTHKVKAENKKHFDHLVRSYSERGFMLVTLLEEYAQLETDTETVVIERQVRE